MRVHSKDGSLNETMILNSLNKHYYKDLDPKWKKHMKRMIKDIEDDDLIVATYYEYKDAKPDIVIEAHHRRIYLSIKSGHSPTVHTEMIYSFYDFLSSLGVPRRIIKIIAFYHSGYSHKEGFTTRVLPREEIIEKYGYLIKESNQYFASHPEVVKEIIYRTIFKGRLERDIIDYFYYGSALKGFLLSPTDIINIITSDHNDECSSICFDQLTYVAGDRNPEGKRHKQLKINWPVLCKWFYDESFMKKYGYNAS